MRAWWRTMNTARRVAMYSAGGGASLLVAEMWYVRAKFRLPPDASGPLAGVCEPPETPASATPQRQRNIIFLGDSLVTGVGCSHEASASNGPVLPRHVASILAHQLGAPIGWRCLGETGADASMCQRNLLPLLRDETQRLSTAGQRVDAVVVMTGLNDIKECLLFANPQLHPWKFGALMEALLCSIREAAGHHCALLVPGCPIEAVPRFNDLWPLSSATQVITRLWEDQKQSATEAANAREQACGASDEDAIRFLTPPPHMVQRLLDGASYFAPDGMHPNDTGYTVWAELIASELLSSRMVADARQTEQRPLEN